VRACAYVIVYLVFMCIIVDSAFTLFLLGRPNTPSGENDDFVVRLSAPEGDI
jgi:hypothetical protein